MARSLREENSGNKKILKPPLAFFEQKMYRYLPVSGLNQWFCSKGNTKLPEFVTGPGTLQSHSDPLLNLEVRLQKTLDLLEATYNPRRLFGVCLLVQTHEALGARLQCAQHYFRPKE